MRRTPKKLKHQSPKKWRINRYNYIQIKGDFGYCASHNFVYDSEEESRKHHDGQACYHTDARFIDSNFNFYSSAYLYHRRWKSISLKSCIRRTLKCKGISVGTVVSFSCSWYYPKKKFGNEYLFKVKKDNPFDVTYEVSVPSYHANFNTCERSKQLTDALRAAGFLVSVSSSNTNRLTTMMNTALAYTGSSDFVKDDSEGESAVAYGYGKRIGFSSGNHRLFGYSDGRENILWDWFGEFDKWSRCYTLPKTESIEDILFILKKVKDVEVPD